MNHAYYCPVSTMHLILSLWKPPTGKIVEVGAPDSRGGYMVVVFTKVSGEPSRIDPICCPECGSPLYRERVHEGAHA